MSLDFVTESDAQTMAQELLNTGLSEEQTTKALPDALAELDYQRSKTQGPPVPIKAMLAGFPRLASQQLSGLETYLPLPGLETASKYMESKVPLNWERQGAEVAANTENEGTLNPFKPGGLAADITLAASQIPLATELIGTILLTGGLGTGPAVAGGVAKTASAVTTGMKMANMAKNVAAAFPLVATEEAGSFKQQNNEYGFDEDILRSTKIGRAHV